MYTLDMNSLKKQMKIYLGATIFCVIFTAIYESFSHQVYSNYMIFAFLIPLIGGAGASFLMIKTKEFPLKIGNDFYNASIATLTIGSIFQGVLEIYGTTNSKVYIYLIVGIVLLFLSVILYGIKKN